MATLVELDVALQTKGQAAFQRDLKNAASTIALTAGTVALVTAAFVKFTTAGGRALQMQQGLTNQMGDGEAALRLMRRSTRGMVSDVELLARGQKLAEEANKKYAKALGVTVEELTAAQRQAAFMTIGMRELNAEVSRSGGTAHNAGTAFMTLGAELKNNRDRMAEIVAGSARLETSIGLLIVGARGMRGEWDGAGAALERFVRAYVGLGEATGKGFGEKGGGRAKVELMSQEEVDALASAAREAANLDSMIQILSDSIIEVQVGAINPLTGKLLDFGDATRFLGGVSLPELDLSMQDASVQARAMQLAVQALNDEISRTSDESAQAGFGLSNMFGLVAGLGGIGGLLGISLPFLSKLSSGLSAFSGFSSFGGGRASGGPVSSGTAYMVGEKGPELFVPGTSGSIVPNGAGMSLTINVPPARNPAAAARDPEWTRAIAEAIRVLEGNGFRATVN